MLYVGAFDLSTCAAVFGPALRSRIATLERELREGYRYVRGERLIFLFCVLLAIYNAFIRPMGFVYFPFFSTRS